jgi:hypothetical protein
MMFLDGDHRGIALGGRVVTVLPVATASRARAKRVRGAASVPAGRAGASEGLRPYAPVGRYPGSSSQIPIPLPFPFPFPFPKIGDGDGDGNDWRERRDQSPDISGGGDGLTYSLSVH